MNLQQLEAVCGIARHGYNMTAAAEALGRTQSALSRQLKELESELGVQIFVRTRNKIVGLAPHGEQVMRVGQRVLKDLKALAQVAHEDSPEARGELRIATTHVHARYMLPATIKAFTKRYPGTVLTLEQCDPRQCRALIAAGDADVGVITMSQKPADPIVTIPAYRIPRCVIAPIGHPLSREPVLTLKKLAEYPLVAYPATFSGRIVVEDVFTRAGLTPRIVCSATDADVCKAYVEIGMGVAVLAKMAYDPVADKGLVAMDAAHLFPSAVLSLVFRKHDYLTRPLESFITLFAPHLRRDVVHRALRGLEIDRARLAQRAPAAPGSALRAGAR